MHPSLTIPVLRKKTCAGNFTALGTAVLPLFDVGPEVGPLPAPAPLLTGTPWLRMPVAGPDHDDDDEAEVLPSLRKVK